MAALPDVFKVIPSSNEDVEFVLAVTFHGGPISIAVTDQAIALAQAQTLDQPGFTDAETRHLRFDSDPYFRTPERCVASGSLIVRAPNLVPSMHKRVVISLMFVNQLRVAARYSLRLTSPNHVEDPLVTDTQGRPVQVESGSVEVGEAANVVILIAG